MSKRLIDTLPEDIQEAIRAEIKAESNPGGIHPEVKAYMDNQKAQEDQAKKRAVTTGIIKNVM
ncbi:MAG: hypothetical protein ABIN94_01145 [Ferruginibacter sp.]